MANAVFDPSETQNTPDPTVNTFVILRNQTGLNNSQLPGVRGFFYDLQNRVEFSVNIDQSFYDFKVFSFSAEVKKDVDFGAGTWTNSNVAQLGGTGAPKLVASSNPTNQPLTNQPISWSLSEATWVSTESSGQQRTATYTGGIFTSHSFNGPVTITTTYGVGSNDIPNTDIVFSILNPQNQAVIFSSVTRYIDLVVNVNNNTITGKIDSIPSSNLKFFEIKTRFTTSNTENSLMLPLTSIGDLSRDSDADYEYEFDNGNYIIRYTLTMVLSSDSAKKFTMYHTQYFKYYDVPITLNAGFNILGSGSFSDVTSSQNIMKGDNIKIVGLTLSDTSDIPIGDTAIQFSFRDAITNTEHIYTDYQSYASNGIYILDNNQLDDNKKYKIIVTARWPLGYTSSVEGTNDLYVIPRPEINSVVIKNLPSSHVTDKVIDIVVAKSKNALQPPTKIWFDFYTVDTPKTKVASIGGNNGIPIIDGSVLNTYSYSLSNIDLVSAIGLENNISYHVEATVGNGTSIYNRTSDYKLVSFTREIPFIKSVQAYNAMNENGPISEISVALGEYKLYAPSTIDFIFYSYRDESYEESARTIASRNLLPSATATSYPDVFTYYINKSDLTFQLENRGSIDPYHIKVEVTLTNHKGESVKRLSDFYRRAPLVPPPAGSPPPTDSELRELQGVSFSTNVVPVLNLTIDNTWALITNPDNSPSSNAALFSNSSVPLVGISGYFNKTAQFNKLYESNLDTDDTKFKLEYSINTGVNWSPVVRAAIKQKSSTNVSNNDAVYALLSDNIQSSTTGLYDNRFDANSNVVGTLQPEIVFYIPKNQHPTDTNHESFNENNKVRVRVTVVDTVNMFGGTLTEAATTSAEKQIINKIESYDFVVGQSTEPWNSDVPSSAFLDVTMNGTAVPGVTKALFKSTSNNIIEEVDQGWKIVNTAAGTNGADAGKLPKAEIFLYANTNTNITSSNSFQVNQINGLGAYAVIDQHQGAKEYPFFIAYTTPTASDNKESWYKSKLFYAPQSSGDTVQDSSRVGLTLLFTGTDNPSFRPDIPASRRVKYVLLPHDDVQDLTKTFGGYETENIKHIVFSTSSNASASQAGNFNFTLSQTGLTTSSSVLSSLVMKFAKNIVLNIPVDWKSIHAHSVKVSYGYKNSFGAGTWTNSNVAQLGGTGAPKLVGSSNSVYNNQTDAWSFSEATWVSTESSGQQRTATYTGGIFTSHSFNGPVTITTTYGVGTNDIPNTDIAFSILNPATQTVIFSSVTRYTDLVVNVNNKTITGKIDFESANPSYITKTFNYSSPSQHVSIVVDPTQGNTLNYTVAYIVKNTNKGLNGTTEGLTVSKNVPNKYFPTNSSYSISGDSYKTFNTHDESSISFTLGFTPGLLHRIDGVNVYFSSPVITLDGSNINKVRIATYKSSAPELKTIQLLTMNANSNELKIGGDNETALNVLGLLGTSIPHASFKWGDFDVANITFEAYRDNRVLSGTSDSYVGAAYDTANYKESGSKPFAKQVWNVPKLNKVSDYGAITLTGGVRNSSAADAITPTTISWPSISDTNGRAFKYRLKMDKNGETPSIHDEDLTLISKTLDIVKNANAAYTVTVKFVFEPSGGLREESKDTVIVFSTIDVDVSNMAIQVRDPSDTSRVNLSWAEPVVNDGTNAVNIHSQYIEYLISSLPANLSRTRLDAAPNAALIETLTGGKKEYTLPANTTVRMLYEFYMHIKAHIQYTVNGNTQTTVAVPILDSTSTTSRSQYRVSTIPSVSLDNSPILNTLSVKPKLNLNLDARGVENEGFISVVILLTQDGTPNKPDGEQVLLVFPGTSAPFSHDNVIPSTSGSNLVSGSVSTTTPRNQLNTSISTQPSALEYTLKIGAPDNVGKYLPSELTMPLSSDSGFVEGGSANPINYMVILTTRRGTDIDTGSFQYVSLPSVNNLSISYDNNSNQYFADFTISE
jgi:hypothetical protein